MIIFILRIDFWLDIFDKISMNLLTTDNSDEFSGSLERMDTIPVKDDLFIQATPRRMFFSLLDAFHSNPSLEIRLQAIEILKKNPSVLDKKLDKEFEAQIFKWRDLLILNQKEVIFFIFDMMPLLKEENILMLKRFLSLWMEINLENFISAYHSSQDTNCTIALVFGDPYSEDEKINLLLERQEAFKFFLLKEELDNNQKKFAQNCLLQLNLNLDKIRPEPLNTPPVTETSSGSIPSEDTL